MTLGLVLMLFPTVLAPVRATAETCWLDADATVDCAATFSTPPAGSETLLTAEAYAGMTAGQSTALRHLEDEAVEIALELHQLPAGDAPYVKAWAREEVIGLLQKLVMKAVQTPPAERTSDERLVASWIGERIMDRTRRARFQEGEEYVRWAGLDVDRYWSLVRGGASKAVLTDFLSQRPVDMDGSTRETSTGGYCVYRPPAGFTDYDPNTLQICHAPCQSGFSCAPEPTVEQFVAWGAARSGAYDRMQDPMLTVHGARAALGAAEAGFAGRRLLASTAWGVAAYKEIVNKLNPAPVVEDFLRRAAMAHASDLDAFAEAYDALDGALVDKLVGAWKWALENKPAQVARYFAWWAEEVSGVVAKQFGVRLEDVAEKLLAELGDKFARLAKSVSGAAAGWSADILVFNLTALIDASFILDANLKRPGLIAGHVVYARDTSIDPLAWVVLPWGRDAVRFEFMDAVAPYSAAFPLLPSSSVDPRFLVQDPDGGSRYQSSALELGRVVDDRWTSLSVRVSGRWALERWYHPDQGLDVQSLKLGYTNHDLQSEVAWLVPHEDGDYSFFVVAPEKPGFDRDTCREDGTCWESDELRYLDASGNPKIARLEAAQAAQGQALMNPTSPIVGEPVAFSAGSFRPGGAVWPVTYTWRFQQDGCGVTCLDYSDGQMGAAYLPPVGGVTASHTWQQAGTYQVELTALDAEGRKATTTLSVHVSG